MRKILISGTEKHKTNYFLHARDWREILSLRLHLRKIDISGTKKHTINPFLPARQNIGSSCAVYFNTSVAYSSSIIRLPMSTRIETGFT